MSLSAGQRMALGNLARKQAGQEVDWINISDARALTELGLAERSREGWQITAAGSAALQGLDGDSSGDAGDHQLIQMKRTDDEGNQG